MAVYNPIRHTLNDWFLGKRLGLNRGPPSCADRKPIVNHQLEPPPMRSDHETENESSRSRTFSVPVVQTTRVCYKIWHHVTAQVVGWPHHNTNHCLVKWETRPCCEC